MSVVINGSAGVTTNSGAVYNGIQAQTAQASTSGTSISFTNIPSWVRRITVMFSGVSTNGTSVIQTQLGTGGTPTTSGYVSMTSYISATNNTTRASTLSSGFGLQFTGGSDPSILFTGNLTFTLLNSNIWTCTGNIFDNADPGLISVVGSISLAGTLNLVRITTVNGTDTFDAGTINILYE
jgi:hypothetical protein